MADFVKGRLADASSRFAGAYQIAVAAGDIRSQAWSLQDLAWVTTTRGDFAGRRCRAGPCGKAFRADPAIRRAGLAARHHGICAVARRAG
jgi:hypothetical protein